MSKHQCSLIECPCGCKYCAKCYDYYPQCKAGQVYTYTADERYWNIPMNTYRNDLNYPDD